MNRAERRKKKIKQAEVVYNIKASDLHAIREATEKAALEKAADLAIPLMLGLPIMVLRDKYGFGKKRCQEFADFVLELYDSFDKGYIELEDCINTLKEEVELEIVMGKVSGRK